MPDMLYGHLSTKADVLLCQRLVKEGVISPGVMAIGEASSGMEFGNGSVLDL
jgi:hypothetical protein